MNSIKRPLTSSNRLTKILTPVLSKFYSKHTEASVENTNTSQDLIILRTTMTTFEDGDRPINNVLFTVDDRNMMTDMSGE